MGKPSPDAVIRRLQEGNERFARGRATHPHTDVARLALAGTKDQEDYAFATIIACSDSRVPVELIFDAGIMDLFVIRVVGNVCKKDAIGSIEYGLAHVQTPLLVVLGHTQCGAVKAVTRTIQGSVGQFERNIPPLMAPIIPAVKRAIGEHGETHGEDILPIAIETNVWKGIEDLFMKSPAVRKLVQKGIAKVVGAVYDVKTGLVQWLPWEKSDSILQSVEASPDKETQVYASLPCKGG